MSSSISTDVSQKMEHLALDDSGIQLDKPPTLSDRVHTLFQELASTISNPRSLRVDLRDDIESLFDQIETLRDDEESTEITTTYDNLVDLYNILEYPFSRNPTNLPLRTHQLALAVLNGSYSIEVDEEKALGAGSYGSVYRGSLCQELSAVKCRNTTERRNEQSARHHEREYLALIALKDHPFIIKLLTANDHELFLEFASGGSLQKPKEPLNATQLLLVLCQSADAIAYMHEKGFVHRDIHLGNILLTRHNEVRLSDFGTAVTAEKFEKKVTPEGTVRYMAPEHLLETATPANCQKMDTWSFGIMIWDLLSNGSLKTPYGDAVVFDNDRN